MKKILGYILIVFMFIGLMAMLVYNAVRRGSTLEHALMTAVYTIISVLVLSALAMIAAHLITSED